jgi:hypothetical protein
VLLRHATCVIRDRIERCPGIFVENIYNDIRDVLNKFQGETLLVLDTIGITDTSGNMGKLGQFCENGRRHGYCTDHNFHRNAILAFDR